MVNLIERSIEIILNNQSTSGAYIASPNFKSYQYCWFRDSAFIAYSMDLYGEKKSAYRFHDWAVHTILRYEAKIMNCIDKILSGKIPSYSDYFHSRFLSDGSEVQDDWGNHQLDGLGTWLWSYYQHFLINEDPEISQVHMKALKLIRDYLISLWRYPCYDCWEENPGYVHTYTLASIFAGLHDLSKLIHDDTSKKVSMEIKNYILTNSVRNGHLTKFVGSQEVDANLFGISVPYNLITPDNKVMNKTASMIEKTLESQSFGLHRYSSDKYYGGGLWILLSAWKGWYATKIGKFEVANKALSWIEKQTDENGNLPEQIPISLNYPAYYKYWYDKWGKIASPLLWSHAMYLILRKNIDSKPGK